MIKNESKIRSFKYIHFLFAVALFLVFWNLFKQVNQIEISRRYDYFVYTCYVAFLYFLDRTYNCYLIGYSGAGELIYSQCMTFLILNGAVWIMLTIIWAKYYSPLVLVVLTLLQWILSLIWVLIADRLHRHWIPPLDTVVIYRNEMDLERVKELETNKKLFQVKKYIDISDYTSEDISVIRDELEDYRAIVVAGVPATLRNGIAKYCVERRKEGFFIPHIGDVIMAGSRHVQSFSIPVQRVISASPDPAYIAAKRALDILVSLLGIVITGPFMILTALAIKLYDRGPVIYKQIRLTAGGREFYIYKFRSMRVDAERDGVARLAAADDDRITPIGKVIRAIRFDELPQLFNILKGDMTLVGPRPERPEIAGEYSREMPEFALRLQVKAGLTGYAQVYGRYNSTPYDKLEMDLFYINHMGMITDIQLLFATVKILFMKDSTAGVEKGQTTAKKQ